MTDSAPITHACPPDGSGLTPCCGRTPFELDRTSRMTVDPDLVTCGQRRAARMPARPLLGFLACPRCRGPVRIAYDKVDEVAWVFCVSEAACGAQWDWAGVEMAVRRSGSQESTQPTDAEVKAFALAREGQS